MKNENINYANKITSKMVSDLSKVIEVQEFTLDDLTIIINDLKNEQKDNFANSGNVTRQYLKYKSTKTLWNKCK